MASEGGRKLKECGKQLLIDYVRWRRRNKHQIQLCGSLVTLTDQFQWKRDDESLTGVCFRARKRAEESEYRQLFGRVLLQCREKNSIAAVETIKQRFFFFFLKFKIKNYFQNINIQPKILYVVRKYENNSKNLSFGVRVYLSTSSAFCWLWDQGQVN